MAESRETHEFGEIRASMGSSSVMTNQALDNILQLSHVTGPMIFAEYCSARSEKRCTGFPSSSEYFFMKCCARRITSFSRSLNGADRY